jgi:serine/threonine protein kinase
LAFPPWVSLELVPGGDLSHYLKRSTEIPLNEALVIIYGVAAGLRALHDSGWVHRDVTPVNILLDAKCRPLLTGFHYIGFISPENRGRRALIGSPRFLAPEIAIDHDQKYTTKVDIYSLGMVLYNLRTHSPPEVLSDPGVPRQIALDESDVFAGLFARMADVNPAQRPTAGDLMIEIENLATENLEGEELDDFQAYAAVLKNTTPEDREDAGSLPNLVEAAEKFNRAFDFLKAVLKQAFEVAWTEDAILAKLVAITNGEEDNLRTLAKRLFDSE